MAFTVPGNYLARDCFGLSLDSGKADPNRLSEIAAT